jgi:uncharacterized protein (TIGR04222 family)
MFMELNPLNFNGPTFLSFFTVLLFVGIVVQVLVRTLLLAPLARPSQTGKPPQPLSLYELAYLRGQALAVGQVGIIELLNQRLIEPDLQTGRFRAIGIVDRRSANLLPEVPATLLRACQSGAGLKPGAIRKEISFAAERLRDNLEQLGLVHSSVTRFGTAGTSALVFGSLLVLGMSKLLVGLERDKPVGFLILMLVAALLLAILMGCTKHLNSAGQKRLEETRNELGKETPMKSPNPRSDSPLMDPSSVAVMSIAVLGLSATGSTFFLDADSRRLLDQAQKSAATSGTGCGATGCGGGDGGGGGGGCGGGGCGGCGS